MVTEKPSTYVPNNNDSTVICTQFPIPDELHQISVFLIAHCPSYARTDPIFNVLII